METNSNRSLRIYAGVAVALLALVFGGIYALKYVHVQPTAQQQTAQTRHNSGSSSTDTNNNSENNNKGQQNVPPTPPVSSGQSDGNTTAGTSANAGPSDSNSKTLPSTGIDSNIYLMALLLSVAAFFATFAWRRRRLLQGRPE